jgi:hypothetical protein
LERNDEKGPIHQEKVKKKGVDELKLGGLALSFLRVVSLFCQSVSCFSHSFNWTCAQNHKG